MRRSVISILAVLVIAAGAAGAFFYRNDIPLLSSQTALSGATQTEDQYTQFEMEAFDMIETNYWQKVTDAQLGNLFQLSLQKASNASSTVVATDRPTTQQMFANAFSALPTPDAKQQLAVSVLQVALYNLAPAGRNELLSAQAVQNLRNTVSNVNPAGDLYNELGVTASATVPQVQAAYDKTKAALEASSSPEAAQKLVRAQYVNDVLTNQQDKARYDATHAEPTVFAHVIGTTLYLDIDKISPATVQEFADAVTSESHASLSSMVIDMRGNIGGDLDLASQFVGLFIGPNQYGFDLFHQGTYAAEWTPQPSPLDLSRFKEIAVLTDDMTQSTAEVITAALKREHLVTTVGTTTRGWGTVENTYPLSTSIDPSTQYALLLVNSLTLREDNQPIEGAGVVADVPTASADWKAQLAAKFKSSSLVSAIERTLPNAPLQ